MGWYYGTIDIIVLVPYQPMAFDARGHRLGPTGLVPVAEATVCCRIPTFAKKSQRTQGRTWLQRADSDEIGRENGDLTTINGDFLWLTMVKNGM